MRFVSLSLIGALSLVTGAASVAAATIGNLDTQNPNIIRAVGGCGFGLHPNRWGDCIPNRYGKYRMNPYYGVPYSGGGYYEDYRHHETNEE